MLEAYDDDHNNLSKNRPAIKKLCLIRHVEK